MIDFKKDLEEAALRAASIITTDLQSYLTMSGWPREAAKAAQIFYSDKGFELEITGPGSDLAQTLEYGNEQRRPTAAIRKYFNRSGNLDELFLKAVEEKLGAFA